MTLLSFQAAANTVYVDLTGTCAGNTPCVTTLQEAANTVTDPATILVFPGDYNDAVFFGPYQSLEIQAVDASGNPAVGTVDLIGAGGRLVDPGAADRVSIRGVNASSGTSAFVIDGGSEVDISDAVISSESRAGLQLSISESGSRVQIQNVIVNDNAGSGIELELEPEVENAEFSITLLDVTANSNTRSGIEITDDDSPFIDSSIVNVTAFNVTAQDNEAGDGLRIDANNGTFRGDNIVARRNSDDGVDIKNAQTLIITNSEATDNDNGQGDSGSDGFELEAFDITAVGLVATGNVDGIQLEEFNFGNNNPPFGRALVGCIDVSGNRAAAISAENMDASSSVRIRQSNIAADNGLGVILRGDSTADATVSATGNWWGTASGPTHLNNPGGTGAVVADGINVVDDSTGTIAFGGFVAAELDTGANCVDGLLGPVQVPTMNRLGLVLLIGLIMLIGFAVVSRQV
ncbi:MAG: right-handed parallel beta-helix repeat-containing protein [Pseudomonadota bacterium]